MVDEVLDTWDVEVEEETATAGGSKMSFWAPLENFE